MTDKTIWIVFTKSKILEGCPLAMDDSEYLYGECFVPAHTEAEARLSVKAKLLDVKLELTDILKCLAYNPTEWGDGSEFAAEVGYAASQAKQADAVTLGIFRTPDIKNMNQ